MSAIRTMLRRLVDSGGQCDRKDFDGLGIGYSVSSRVAEMQAVGWVEVKRIVTITDAGRRELERLRRRSDSSAITKRRKNREAKQQ